MLARGPVFLVAAALVAISPLLAFDASASAGFDGGAFLGDASVHYRLTGAPLPAAAEPMLLQLDGDVAGIVEARLVPPGDGAPSAWFALDRPGPRAHESLVLFPRAGDWRVELRAQDGATAAFDVHVWPAADAFLKPANAATAHGIAIVGEPADFAVQLVDAAGKPYPAPADAVARVTGPDGASWTAPLVPRDGALVLDAPWEKPGAYLVDVSSVEAGVPPDSRPSIGVHVATPEEASVYQNAPPRETPLGPVALVGLALAALAVASRRRA